MDARSLTTPELLNLLQAIASELERRHTEEHAAKVEPGLSGPVGHGGGGGP